MADNNNSLYENSEYPSRRQAPGRERRQKKDKRKRGGIGRVVGFFFKLLGTLILIGLCTGALLCCFAAVYINEVIVPIADLSPDDFPMGENSIMYYQDKATGEYKEMTTLLNVTSSIRVGMDEIPQYLIDATVAIEDKRFWEHPGVDWKRTAKAVLSMFTGQDISGGSTITQQLLKNMTNYNEVTVKRKITEIVRAVRFTQNNSKESTLLRYLNIIPLGSGCEGVGAASLEYFGKPVSELTLAECASLIGITNNPSKYGPYSFARSKGVDTDEIWDARQWNKYRQEVVLYQMLDQGKITRAEYDEAVAQELRFVRAEGEEAETQIYTWYEETVISDVRRALISKYGWSDKMADEALQSGGLRIYTCYDPTAQALAEQVYFDRSNLDYTSKDGQLLQSAICVIDNRTGDVAAIVGRFGEKTLNRGGNYANDGHRQPGSSFKPLAVYSPALEMGKISPFSVIDDYPYQVLNGRVYPLNGGYASYHGRVTVRQALKESLNTVAVRIMMEYNGGVTPEESFNFVQDRYHIDLEPGRMVNGEMKTDITISLSMGGLTDGVNVREMAEAYSTFPNNGVYKGSRTYTKVTQMIDGRETLLLDNTLTPQQVIKETTAYYMNDMLQGVFTAGGTAVGRGGALKSYHVAGKTGTTNNDHDRWFVGYTPYYTAAVWTGYEQGATITGAPFNVALDLWEKVMVPLHEGLDPANYPQPAEMRSIIYCKDSGLIATEYCAMDPRGDRRASDTIFPEDYPTDKRCTFHTEASVVTICVDSPVTKEDGAQTGLYHLAGEFCPEESKRDICLPDYERERVGNATAGDEAWRYASAASHGGCTVHLEAPPPEEPDVTDPNNPVDPSNPSNPGGATNPSDPSYNPYDPYYNPGGTKPGESGTPGGGNQGGTASPEPNKPPDTPINPLPPSDGMVG